MGRRPADPEAAGSGSARGRRGRQAVASLEAATPRDSGKARALGARSRGMPENQLLALVRELAQKTGWLDYHPWWSGHSTAGFPDLVLVRGGRLVFVELKRQDGLLSDDQLRWIAALSATCAEAYVWRPDAWTSGEVLRVLQPDGAVVL